MSRPASIAASQPPALPYIARPSLSQLFVANLRLLDLDQLPDWPSITPRSFSTRDGQQNQKQRIRCVEWALYRLFELWDQEETRDKLQPFFPPLEPLQSLNLRAALYRSLDQLKKNGVLGRECMLRKTMLDECKGEKLMEILFLFSTAVLRKVELSQKSIPHKPISVKLAASPVLNAAQQGSLIPLSLALRASLGRLLKEKAEKRAKCKEFDQLLGHKDQQLQKRTLDCQKSAQSCVSPTEEGAIRTRLQANWPGTSKWTDVMIDGDEVHPGDMPLRRPFIEVWNVIAHGGSLQSETGDTGLLANLERRVRLQRERLHQWQTFREKITSCMGPSSASSDPKVTTQAENPPTFRFEKHRQLQLSGEKTTRRSDELENPIEALAKTPYGLIVEQMKRELSEASKASRKEGSARKYSANVEVSRHNHVEAFNEDSIPELRSTELGQTDKLFAVGSRGSSLDQGRSAGFVTTLEQRTSLSSIFSPAKKPNQPLEQPESPADISLTDILGLDKLETNGTALDASPVADTVPSASHQQVDIAEDERFHQDTEREDVADAIITSVLAAGPSPEKKGHPSLAERTRLSMASVSQVSLPSRKEEQTVPSIAIVEPVASECTDRRASLLDRTRQSMSRLPAQPAVRSKKPTNKKPRPSSMIYPVNQFETPGRAKVEPIRNSTPTEILFSPDADYSTVFKSRPKIALSPVISPDDSSLPAIESSSELDDSMDSVLNNSSPLAARIFSAEAK